MTAIDIEQLKGIVIQAAERELLPRFMSGERREKRDGSVITEADTAMQSRLGAELAAHWPDIPLLGEEMDESSQRSLLQDTAEGLWCVDPLDGTSNFAAGIPFFAVSVALLREGRSQLGVVYDPVRRARRWRPAMGNCSGNGAGGWRFRSPTIEPDLWVGQEQGDPGAAQRRAFFDMQLAAVDAGDILDDGETDAVAGI